MSELGFGSASSDLLKEQNPIAPEGIQPRFFQKQTAEEGGCAFRAFNNVVGKPAISRAMVRKAFRRETKLFRACPKNSPDPGKNENLISARMLEFMARQLGYALKRVSAGRSPQDKFEWLLTQTKGQFLVVTATDFNVHASDGHDLRARNHHHWIAVSIDEYLVIDSLARTLGPQRLSRATLQRSVRDGVLKIYAVEPARQRLHK